MTTTPAFTSSFMGTGLVLTRRSPHAQPPATRPRSGIFMEAAAASSASPAAPPAPVSVSASTPVRKRGVRTPTFRKLQTRRQEGPRSFREKEAARTELAAERKAAETLARQQLTEHRKERRRTGTPLSELVVGSEVTGVVHNLVRHGAYVDIGASRDGLCHVRDMSVAFVHSPADLVKPGQPVTCWVKYVNTQTNTLALTMRKPILGIGKPEARMPLDKLPIAALQAGRRYEGFVERVTNYGAYIDIGAERSAFLHVNNLWGRRPRETLDSLTLGRRMWVVVTDIDEIRSYVTVNARGCGLVPLDGAGNVDVDKQKETVTSGVEPNVVMARPGDDEKNHNSNNTAHAAEGENIPSSWD